VPSPSTVLAVVFDCDDTLAPDTTVQLLKAKGVDPTQFWASDIAQLVRQDWDPPLAFMSRIAELANSAGPLSGLNKTDIEAIGRKLQFYPGIPAIFPEVRKMIEGNEKFSQFGISIEFYIISGGIEDLIRAHPIAQHMKDIWACNFEYDEKGQVRRPKRIVSFTEKTRFLFNIQKGLTGSKYRSQPYAVNVKVASDELRVPFENMIYIGDGPSDIPCMSVLERNKGDVIGILSEENPYKTYALTYGRRARYTIPPDYRNGQIGRKHLDDSIVRAAEKLVRKIEFERGQSPIPGY
jgi:hypothetical protein